MKDEEILDATCGGRSIWLPENKDRKDTLYIDKRSEEPGFHGQEGRTYGVDPDEIEDFRDLPYEDGEFNHIVFDPPHFINDKGQEQLTGILEKKYGALRAETWRADIRKGFEELMRVLRPGGTLAMKWADNHIDHDEVLDQIPQAPLYGTTTKKANCTTRWYIFYKEEDNQ